MLKLVVLPPAFGMRNVSPYCLKIEMLLTAHDIPFELTLEPDPRKTPKGKLPYLIDNDKTIADSELIVEHINDTHDGCVYAGLSPESKALGVAISRLAEDHLYWMIVASRWLDDTWWPHVKQGFFDPLPPVIRTVAASMARKQVVRTYHLQGLGRHTLEEQKGFAHRDLSALQTMVPDLGYLAGEAPGVYDFTLASILSGMFDNQPATWLTTLAQPYDSLRRYAERVQEHTGVFGRHLAN